MTDDQINRLLELKKKLDAREITQEVFDLCVAAIQSASNEKETVPKQVTSSSKEKDSKKKRSIIIAAIVTAIALLSSGLLLLLNNKDNADVQVRASNEIFRRNGQN